ncbi:MAG: hypothetical protein K2K81_02600, partial [Muribaculaceae bacterium]|nr:hypothetical protein [Muribaculaceae bacterium]
MFKKFLSIIAVAAISVNNVSATEIADFCGVFDANLTVLDLGPFGNAGDDWTPVTFEPYQVTVTAEGNTLRFENLFPLEDGSISGEFDPETSTVVFQPQPVLGNYTFCGYPTGDWWMDNKLTEEPTPCSAKVSDGVIVFDMWSIVSGVDVLATNYYNTTLTPIKKDLISASMLEGKYVANPFIVLDLEPFGSSTEDWNIVDLSNHEVIVSANEDELTFTGFFPYEGGNLTGKFDSETMTVTFDPQTVMNDYIFCAYPTGDWWMDNKLTEDPAPMTATINNDNQFV